MTVVDAGKMKRYARLRGMSVSDLAAEAGLSRQAVYQMMKPGYRPVSSGLESVAGVLGLDAVDLLCRTDRQQDHVEAVVATARAAAAGDPRAFETLPACILDLGSRHHSDLNDMPRPLPRLLAAAGQVALHLKGLKWLERFVSMQSSWTSPELAFFFGSELMDTSRIVGLTPEPMAVHKVFGVFELGAFSRHIR